MSDQLKHKSDPIALHQHAEDNLRYIRATMESATSFTGVSGLGYVMAGLSALPAAWLAARQPDAAGWLVIWMLELVLASGVALALTACKAVKQGGSLASPSGRKLLLAFLPAMAAGGLVTLSFFLSGHVALLPGIWLSLYGAAVMTAGAWSVRIIPVMGGMFMVFGAVTLLGPVSGDFMLALGMGGLHIIFGILIWRHHGG
ncbi:MAG: hypothetical protein Q8L60_13135 [Gammaproteobacteria bacterium]|nr:hypothetical protein [Gammaproteobacteria bacterium]MDP2142200.1 hypothetical protein [Gammaproteobacteria bacterium]MDP2348288.1 hypothetical protein [Gammaproteobacteria bacterium]